MRLSRQVGITHSIGRRRINTQLVWADPQRRREAGISQCRQEMPALRDTEKSGERLRLTHQQMQLLRSLLSWKNSQKCTFHSSTHQHLNKSKSRLTCPWSVTAIRLQKVKVFNNSTVFRSYLLLLRSSQLLVMSKTQVHSPRNSKRDVGTVKKNAALKTKPKTPCQRSSP